MMSRWAPVCTFYYSGRFYAALRDDDNTSSLCVTGNTSECNVFTQILYLDKSWWNITSWCRHKLAYTMLKIRNFAKNLQPPAQSWCRNLCCVQNETCCSSSVGERQADKQREREREISVSLWFPACVCGTAGKWNEKVVPGHKPTNPTSAYSDKSQRNTGDLSAQASAPTVQQIKSSAALWPKGIKLKSERENGAHSRLGSHSWQNKRVWTGNVEKCQTVRVNDK